MSLTIVNYCVKIKRKGSVKKENTFLIIDKLIINCFLMNQNLEDQIPIFYLFLIFT